ncbi:hypothetical protein DSM02_2529 [Leeuwenhoekiella polynyae]|uniref:Uncharacterized protein n=1 Tax=Leeuwenhoekiella polynyae TaxID=1550906 RepID=A0A4Q0P2T8_9FLAO|nr:hypothetical protein DSM02_2529 [Leeuwenhoekiella polynyae]
MAVRHDSTGEVHKGYKEALPVAGLIQMTI